MFNQSDKDEFEAAKNELHHDWGRKVIVHNNISSSNTDFLGQNSSSVVTSDSYEILAYIVPAFRAIGEKGDVKGNSRIHVPEGIRTEISLVCRITKENLAGRQLDKISVIEIDGKMYNILWFAEERVEYFTGIKCTEDESIQIVS